MKTSHALVVWVLTAATISVTAFAATPTTTPSTDAIKTTNNWLPMATVIEKISAAGYQNIYEIEREKEGYEVEAYDRSGKPVELMIDPLNGTVLKVK